MKLSDLVKEKEIKIPNTDFIIKIYSDWSWYDKMTSTKIVDVDERSLFLMTKLIKSWNLIGDDEKILPIEENIIKRLPDSIVAVLLENIKVILDEKSQKKKS